MLHSAVRLPEALPRFGMDVGFDDHEVVVFVRGEVDLLTASTLGAGLVALAGEGYTRVTVDLSHLAFMDAAGFHVIIDVTEHLARTGGVLVVRSPPALTRRFIQIAGIADRVTLTPLSAPPTPSARPTAAPHGSSGEQDPPGNDDAADRQDVAAVEMLRTDLTRVRSRRADTAALDAALGLITVLTRATVEGADGVSVTLPRHGRMVTVASTDQTIRQMDAHQYATGQGPCLSAAEEGRSFHVASLADEVRWPDFVPRAQTEGIASILSTPLTGADGPLGALNIYSTTPGTFGLAQQELASLLAHHASELLTDPREEVTDAQFATRINEALMAREVIAQHRASTWPAKGSLR